LPGDLELRAFESEDAAEVAGWLQSSEGARDWGGPATEWPLRPEQFQSWHHDPDVRPYVLVAGESAVAYGEIWLDREEQEVELARLLVRPERRGQGIGTHLVRALLGQAALTGLPRAFIRVAPGNQPAIRCYRRAGFLHVSPAAQRHYNEGQPLEYLWLEHALSPAITNL
jgi:[ribosomal protein S18]-alanine N-acetyltransferase